MPKIPSDPFDIIVIPGDNGRSLSHVGQTLSEWIVANNIKVPVLYVPGNHCYYNADLEYEWLLIKNHASYPENLHILDNKAFIHQGYRFLCATLWTDHKYDTSFDHPNMYQQRYLAYKYMNDYRLITKDDKPIQPEDLEKLHEESRQWFLSLPPADNTIVVTHHLPLPDCLDPRFAKSTANHCFCSDRTDLVVHHSPLLWLSGHTHACYDFTKKYEVTGKETRFVCNPFGYVNPRTGMRENSLFNPALILTVKPRIELKASPNV